MATSDQKSTVRAVERALDILLCFTDETELSLTDISNRIVLHKSTVFRLLASLEGKGFVVRDSSSDKYKLGFRIWELSANLSHSDDPATLFLPDMERLRDQLGETISLYIRDGCERIRIQAVQSEQAIRRVALVGARLPLSVGASSKVLVAYENRDVQEQLLNEMDWTASVSRDTYTQQLVEIQKVGYATSVEEREAGAAAVSAPIINRSGKIVAALSVSGPANRLTIKVMQQHAALIMETAIRMGKMIR